MARKCTWLQVVIVGSLLMSTVCLAQPRQTEVIPVSVERLSDKELDQIQGQGAFTAPSNPEQPVAAIKLWDEFLRPQGPAAPTNVGQNLVILSGPKS